MVRVCLQMSHTIFAARTVRVMGIIKAIERLRLLVYGKRQIPVYVSSK